MIEKTSNVPPRRMSLVLLSVALLALTALSLLFFADATPTTGSTRRLFGLWRARHALFAAALVIVAFAALLAAVSRRALLALAAVVLGATGSYVTLELAGLTGLLSWPSLLENGTELGALGTERKPHLDVRGTTLQDIAAGWGVPSEPLPFHYRTDRYGLRNEPDRSEADVYLLGDSILVAALVPFKQTVTARLERALRRPVMQVALIGIAPQREHQIFRDLKLNLHGKLVVQFIFEGNDLSDSRDFRYPGSKQDKETLYSRTLANQVWRILATFTEPTLGISALRSCTISGQKYLFGWAKESFTGYESETVQITNAVQLFAREVRAQGGELAVVFVPSKLRVLGPTCQLPKVSHFHDLSSHLGPLRAHMHAWSKSSGVALLDLTEPLQAVANAGRIPWLWGDTHWNATGHEVAAMALARWKALKPATAPLEMAGQPQQDQSQVRSSVLAFPATY